ncbi:MAG: ArsR/SmtB family transcription factor [Asticcacaulis sp.]
MDAFSALADPTRRQIVETLAQHGQMTASDIASRFDISKSGISQHLKILRGAGLVEMEVKAQFRLYRLCPDAMEQMAAWLIRMRWLWSQNRQRQDAPNNSDDA